MNKFVLLLLSAGYATAALAQVTPPATGPTSLPSVPPPAAPIGTPEGGVGNAPPTTVPATPPQRPPSADRGIGSSPIAPTPAPRIGQSPTPGSVVDDPRP